VTWYYCYYDDGDPSSPSRPRQSPGGGGVVDRLTSIRAVADKLIKTAEASQEQNPSYYLPALLIGTCQNLEPGIRPTRLTGKSFV